MNIVVLDGYTVVRDDLNWDFFEKYGDLKYYERTSQEDVISRIDNAEIVITSKCLIDKNVINSCPNIKYIGVIATGYNNIDIGYAKEKGIAVTNIPAYSTDSVAQFTFALILEAANHVGMHNRSVHDGDWTESKDFCYSLLPQTELAGKTIGIIGYGNIGKKVAEIAKNFGMNVLVHSSHMSEKDSTLGIHFTDLDNLLTCSQIITLHCALTDTTRGMINTQTINTMKDGVIIVNTSRGPIINEYDLANALREKKVGAACLDVLVKEPPDAENPLMGIDNCIITPHIAWLTEEARSRIINTAEKNIISFLNEERLNRVD